MRKILDIWREILKIWIVASVSLVSNSEVHYCRHDGTQVDCKNFNFKKVLARQYPVNIVTITHLSFDHCFIEDLDVGVFDQLQELIYLDISHNAISNLRYDVFRMQNELRYLDLSHNKLEILNYSLFIKLTKLTFLNLENNKIKFLPDKIFTHQKNLTKIRLSCNNLTTFNERVLAPLTNLQELEMYENPFICDCNILLVKLWCENHTIETGATCKYASNVTSWSSLSPDLCLANSSEHYVMFSNILIISITAMLIIILASIIIVFILCKKFRMKKSRVKSYEDGRPTSRHDSTVPVIVNHGQESENEKREGTGEKIVKTNELSYYSSGIYSYITPDIGEKSPQNSEMCEENPLYEDYFNNSRLELM